MIKRFVDILGSGVGLILSLPLLLLVGALVMVYMGRPVIYRQKRPGWQGKLFTMVKFRTMKIGDGPDAERINGLGRFLRSTSLDELPELWNVLKGDMSLVGPRPLLEEYLPLYTPEQARRHEVRPGITGWAQINGRNAISWEKKFDLDIWYVDHRSFGLDLKILLITAWRILTRQGISAPGEATMPRFTGSRPSA